MWQDKSLWKWEDSSKTREKRGGGGKIKEETKKLNEGRAVVILYWNLFYQYKLFILTIVLLFEKKQKNTRICKFAFLIFYNFPFF